MKVIATTAVALVLAALPALAQDAPKPATVTQANAAAPPSAADLLFDQPQMKNAAPGSTITYDYLRRSGIEKGLFGPPLNDTLTLKLEPGKSAEARDISVVMFSGLNRVPAGPFEDMTGNPVVSLFLENHLRALAKVLEANPRYLKLAIRKGLRDGATVTPTKVTVDGREVDGWRVETKPFANDAMEQRMRGMDKMTYTFITSPAVPGQIVSIEASSKDPEGGELLEEKLSYDQKAG
ncbi:hypothetical protein [Methylobacterium sp. NEAU K]|uniref:hypothetical protein n=1 Tax=Methylobacterium sp. NEAU K TaxID=3064946 RepID=UPI0027361B94|nr:hypothetical protein [Methylobacterium sp. NEAU K]MDP4002504.1 hypothetical protein [Methylobacterium sp. NEAU K]